MFSVFKPTLKQEKETKLKQAEAAYEGHVEAKEYHTHMADYYRQKISRLKNELGHDKVDTILSNEDSFEKASRAYHASPAV
jgi:hypothetical protein